jgi:hypothetical protein
MKDEIWSCRKIGSHKMGADGSLLREQNGGIRAAAGPNKGTIVVLRRART